MQASMHADEHTDWRVVDEGATTDQRTYAMVTHLVSVLGALDGLGIISFVATLIMWLVKRAESPFIDDHGREAVNFQISLLILAIGGAIVLGIITGILTVLTIGVYAMIAWLPFLLGYVGLVVLRIVGCVRGAIAAHRGQIYRYPMCVRLIPEKA